VHVLTERKFPDWHITYEKAQVALYGKNYEWNIVADTDALVHPDLPDLTTRVPDFAVGILDGYPADTRFAMNPYFARDRRKMGVSGLLAVAHRHCFDFWTPLPGRQEEHLAQITPLADERARGVPAAHFITEYWLSYNLARFGLKYTGLLQEDERRMFFHPYGWFVNGVFHSPTNEEKIRGVLEKAREWGLLK
jgi:hypothetical protein